MVAHAPSRKRTWLLECASSSCRLRSAALELTCTRGRDGVSRPLLPARSMEPFPCANAATSWRGCSRTAFSGIQPAHCRDRSPCAPPPRRRHGSNGCATSPREDVVVPASACGPQACRP
eukprot:365325-Chlamydomonas_euryale.AAC.42